MVTGWSPAKEEDEGEEEGAGARWEVVDGTSCGPGIAVVGMTVEEREGVDEEVGAMDE